MFKKFSIIAMSTVISSVMLLSGCGGTTGNTDTSPDNGVNEVESGSKTSEMRQISVAGSSALQPLAERVAQMYMDNNANDKITVSGGGSGNGIKQVYGGVIDIGNSDVEASEKISEEEAAQLVPHKVCMVGFAAVVNSKAGITDISKEDLIKVFTGEVTNWSDVGGENIPITVINRGPSSGTRAVFDKLALDGKEEVEGIIEDSNEGVKTSVEEIDGAISYLATSYIIGDLGFQILSIDGVEPTPENIVADKYKIYSYEYMYTKGEPTGLEKDYLEFFNTDEVKAEIVNQGFIAK